MAKRKSDPSSVAQLDMFGDVIGEAVMPALPKVDFCPEPILPILHAANDAAAPFVEDEIIDEILDTEVGELEGGEENASPDEPQVAVFEAPNSKLPLHEAGTSKVWLNDDWWTTAMVCAYLKLGRKAIWERQRDPRYQFPKPHHFGSMRQRWKSEDVRAWAQDCLGKT
jgi:predicted DNA-binding transcriptional regulator AlpA